MSFNQTGGPLGLMDLLGASGLEIILQVREGCEELSNEEGKK